MRIAHEEQRRKTAHEKQVAADAAARIRDAAATDDATAAATMTSEQRPGPCPAAHGDMPPGRGKHPPSPPPEYPTAIGVPTNGPLEAWGCACCLSECSSTCTILQRIAVLEWGDERCSQKSCHKSDCFGSLIAGL